MVKNVLFLQKMHFFCLKYLVYKDFFVTLHSRSAIGRNGLYHSAK